VALRAMESSFPSQPAVSLLTWNVLADCYSHGLASVSHDAYSECLYWGRRKERIRDIIMTLRTDIICLQEVDHYEGGFVFKI
jgi:mRNA deadenylase 3'-5' endonuclease subunit Ccr4